MTIVLQRGRPEALLLRADLPSSCCWRTATSGRPSYTTGGLFLSTPPQPEAVTPVHLDYRWSRVLRSLAANEQGHFGSDPEASGQRSQRNDPHKCTAERLIARGLVAVETSQRVDTQARAAEGQGPQTLKTGDRGPLVVPSAMQGIAVVCTEALCSL